MCEYLKVFLGTMCLDISMYHEIYSKVFTLINTLIVAIKLLKYVQLVKKKTETPLFISVLIIVQK